MDAHVSNMIESRQLGGGGGLLSALFPPHTRPGKDDTSSSSQALPTTSTTSAATDDPSTSTSTSVLTTSTTSTSALPDTQSSSTTPSITSTTSDPQQTIPLSTSNTVNQITSTVTPSSVVTITQSGAVVPTAESAAAPGSTSVSAAAAKPFLQNKVLCGVVFGLVGAVALVIIVAIATFFIRRRRTNRFLNEAMSFDPISISSGDDLNVVETGRLPFSDKSSIDKSQSSHGNGPHMGYPGISDNTHSVPYTPTSQKEFLPPSNGSLRSFQHGNGYPAYQREWTNAPPYQYPAYNHGASQAAPPHVGGGYRHRSSSSGEFQFAATPSFALDARR